jgi:glutathione synthase/RimK-type ligase-like ATP-grasp enzyme
MSEFLGIAREKIYSPGKVDDDRAILEAVAFELRTRGHRVAVVSAEDDLVAPARGTVVFTMSQGPAALDVLRRWERSGILVINSVDAIEGCHRRRMLPAFEQARIRHPDSVLVSTDANPSLPDWAEGPVWLKRGDVHAMESGDVLRIRGHEAARRALAAFRARGISHALIQRHIEGDVVKFYAVRDCFFQSFVNGEGPSSDDERRQLTALAEAGARALDLEIYGGDCVRDERGAFWLIDLNDWPSYARCRASAAKAIADHLESRARLLS